MNKMQFTVQTLKGEQSLELNYQNLFAIGYAGRSMEKTMEHIKELEEQLGVPAPKKIPTIFQMSNLLLTQDPKFHVVGVRTCGEVEYVIVLCEDKVYIGVGSDHSDRDLEGQSVPKAKQICPKPIGNILWDYEDVKDHWDSIKIISHQIVCGEEILYQSGTLADILPVEFLLKELKERAGDIGNSVIYSGTVPALKGFKYGSIFRCQIIDETLNRTLKCDYEILPISEEER